MAVSATRVILFFVGLGLAALATAYATGGLDKPLGLAPPLTASAPADPAAPDPKDARLPEAPIEAPAGGGSMAATVPEAPAATAPADAMAPKPPQAAPEAAPEKPAEIAALPAEPAEPTAPAGVTAPTFDVVRVESDGSMVVAGKAVPEARIELLTGSKVIGRTTADAGGDFAVVLDNPLNPGDYSIVLRSTAPGGVIAMSVETAIVSIPKDKNGQVLALVEEPGKPSEIISVPKADAPAPPQTAETPAEAPAEAPAANETAAAQPPAAATPAPDAAVPAENQAAAAPAPAEQPPVEQATAPEPVAAGITVEAVEIEGRNLFVAGAARAGSTVRGYANEILLGDAKATPDGRYLIETQIDLPVGDYTIRVDVLDGDAKVVARAIVPFEREPGESIAAVAGDGPAPADAGSGVAPAPPPSAGGEADTAVAAQPPSGGGSATAADLVPPAVEAPAGQPAAAEAAPAEAPAPNANIAAEQPAPAQTPPAGQSADSTAGQPAAPDAAGSDIAAAPEPGQPAEPAAPQSSAAVEPPVPDSSGTAAPAPGADAAVASSPPDDGIAVVEAPKLKSATGAVIIRRGDNLWRISRRVYGKGIRYSTIYLANQTQIANPNLIMPGQVFKVPETSDDGAPADMTGIEGQATTVE